MTYYEQIKNMNINQMACKLADICKIFFESVLIENNLQIKFCPSFLGLWIYLLTSKVEDEIHN